MTIADRNSADARGAQSADLAAVGEPAARSRGAPTDCTFARNLSILVTLKAGDIDLIHRYYICCFLRLYCKNLILWN